MASVKLSNKENLNYFIKENDKKIIKLLTSLLKLDPRVEHIVNDAYGEMNNNFIICDKRTYKHGVLGYFSATYTRKNNEIKLIVGKCETGLFKEFHKEYDDIDYELAIHFSPEFKNLHFSLCFLTTHQKSKNSIQFIFKKDGTTANCIFNKKSKNKIETEPSLVSSQTLNDPIFITRIYEFVKLFISNPEIFKIYAVSDIIDAFPNQGNIDDMSLVSEMLTI